MSVTEEGYTSSMGRMLESLDRAHQRKMRRINTLGIALMVALAAAVVWSML